MKSNDIRKKFLEYFAGRDHTIVASSPLVPGNDPTLLFTNSGMVQFKDVFLGQDKRNYVRATTSQRCVRAGGKHNDLENVGYTARHHTFFEMLGNFSFGDYFKKDAIHYAWELLTGIYQLPKDKLWVTVYQTDDEAYDIWSKQIGVPVERIVRIGDKPGGGSDNFWQMADTGPCGPCSEIFYDHGPDIPGGPPGSPDADGDRYIEIWNLVFMQFNRDDKGKLHPLPKPSVDTGMGLERIAAVLQHVHSNYEIDLFQELIKAAARETKTKDLANNSLKVIADHIRATSFMIVDGVIPGNEGRGYVLRRIIRRAIRHGYQLGQTKPFFHNLVADLVKAMGEAYPELAAVKERVAGVLKQEEERFGETLVAGMQRFETAAGLEARVISYVRSHLVRDFKFFEDFPKGGKYQFDGVFHREGEDVLVEVKRLASLGGIDSFLKRFSEMALEYGHDKDRATRGYVMLVGNSEHPPEELMDLTNPNRTSGEQEKISLRYLSESSIPFDGRDAFHLYDTFGFPLDLTQDLCREKGISIDISMFDAAMDEQRERARAASKFQMGSAVEYSGAKTVFKGYDTLALDDAQVVAIYREGTSVPSIAGGEAGIVVLDRTPFYAESGGQVGDAGELDAANGTFAVTDTQKVQPDVFGHHGKLAAGTLAVGDKVAAKVDTARRARTMRNHSATHLMHKALREVLGPHVQQKGSLVDAGKTRFDFSHNEPMSDEQIRKVEALVNAEVLANAATSARVMKFDEAVKGGAMALFGEKYGDEVRVLDIGSSRELCGGTHVARTGDIGFFKVVGETGIAAGVRRVEAVTAEGALAWVQQQEGTLANAASALKSGPHEVAQKITQMLDNVRNLEKELARLKSKLASSQGDELADQAVEVKGVKVIAATMDGADSKGLRESLDKLKDKLKSAAIVLAAVDGGKVSLIAGVTADLTGKLKAGELVNHVAQQVGGKGGGRPDMAQAGGTDPSKLPQALASVRSWVEAKIN